ncbi:MAG: nuclear transport factor 2 family protein [Actinomycetota bacterium]|nr:nuclear transport factor 2 family protein [Actinomycetota bacterium]
MTAAESLGRLIDAIVAGDPDAVRAAYHPDAKIWHNFDQIEQGVDENIATLQWFIRRMPDRRYEDVVRHPIEGGVVQQHVVRGTTQAGHDVEMPACLFAQVDGDGLITRIEEYVDSSQADVLSRR